LIGHIQYGSNNYDKYQFNLIMYTSKKIRIIGIKYFTNSMDYSAFIYQDHLLQKFIFMVNHVNIDTYEIDIHLRIRVSKSLTSLTEARELFNAVQNCVNWHNCKWPWSCFNCFTLSKAIYTSY
jgi:hypothetical protein